MVAQTNEASAGTGAVPPPQGREEADAGSVSGIGGSRSRKRGGLRRLISSSMRLAEVQYRIVLLRAKLTLVRMAIFVGLIAAAVVLGLVGIIFLYIGAFRLLTDVAGLPVWATFLIYAGVHLVTAVALIAGGARTIAGKDEPHETKKGEGKA